MFHRSPTILADTDPETRANPSRGLWLDQSYLEQRRRRLLAHKYRRLHLTPRPPGGLGLPA